MPKCEEKHPIGAVLATPEDHPAYHICGLKKRHPGRHECQACRIAWEEV